MMWYANLARRQLLELLLAGNIPEAIEVQDLSHVMHENGTNFDVFWSHKPDGSAADLPIFIVVNDSSLKESIATLNSSPQVPSPFTAFCRIVPRSLIPLLTKGSAPPRSEITHGLAGVALAEAAIYSGGSLRVSDISPAACKRTLAFTYGRALAQFPADALPVIIGRWLETRSILGLSSPHFERISQSLIPIFDLAGRVFFNLSPSDTLSAVTSEIIDSGEPSELIWEEISANHIPLPSLKSFAEATREERSSAFQEVMRSLYSRPPSRVSDEAVAGCALAATRISPGTFEHLTLLAQHSDIRLPLWYSFFAALQRQGSALRTNSIPGLRIIRDIRCAPILDGAPSADISSEELRFAFHSSLDHLTRKLGHANEILVELFPGLDASFRFGQRSERKEMHQPKEVPMPFPELTLNQKIDSACKLLEELSHDLTQLRNEPKMAKPAKKRAPKSNRLL